MSVQNDASHVMYIIAIGPHVANENTSHRLGKQQKLTPSKMPQSGPAAEATSDEATQAAVVAAAKPMALPPLLLALVSSALPEARLSGSKAPTVESSELTARRVLEEETAAWEEMGAKADTAVRPAAHKRTERRMVI